MANIRSVLERSLASNNTTATRERRREDIKRIDNPVRRLAGLALHGFATHFPSFTSRLVDSHEYQYVGEGASSVVYRRNSEVVKINKRSVDIDEGARQLMVDTLAIEHRALKKHYGSYVLPQTIAIDRHPLDPRKRAVQIRQPFSRYNLLSIFIHYSDQINPVDLAQDMKDYPGVEYALGELVTKAWEMYEDTSMLPDTIGLGNIVIAEENSELTIVDGQPIIPERTALQGRIKSQLSSLERALEVVA